MASTNQTTHYDLSQYVASDKPTYLVDYNGDMSKIDAGIYGAKSLADTNEASIGTLSNLDTTVKSDLVSAINEVNTQVGTNTGNISTNTQNISANTSAIGVLANLSTTTKTDLVSATNEVNSKANDLQSEIEKFNLVNFKSYNLTQTTSEIVKSNSNIAYEGTIYVATNSDGSIFKVYGFKRTETSGTETGTITLKNTGISPTEAFTINSAGIQLVLSDDTSYPQDISVASNGDISIKDSQWGGIRRAHFLPCLYFAKSFGDQPTPPTP